MGTRQLYPSEVRFSSNVIASEFEDGKDVNEVAENICNGQIHIGDIPIIQIVQRDQKFYTLDNRRLYVFRVAQVRKRVGKIPTLLFNEDRLHPEKHTTRNDGKHVVVEGGETLTHYREGWLKDKKLMPQNGKVQQVVAVKANGHVHNHNHTPTASSNGKVVSNGHHVTVPIPVLEDQISKSSWWACSIL